METEAGKSQKKLHFGTHFQELAYTLSGVKNLFLGKWQLNLPVDQRFKPRKLLAHANWAT